MMIEIEGGSEIQTQKFVSKGTLLRAFFSATKKSEVTTRLRL